MANQVFRYGFWRERATKNVWRKYFRAIYRAMIGASGNSFNEYDVRQLCKFELTTKRGYKNTPADMKHDFDQLRRLWEKKVSILIIAVLWSFRLLIS